MPDPLVVLLALGTAAVVAAAVLLLCGWSWRSPRPGRLAAGWVVGVGAAFYLGCSMIGLWPRWPPREDLDRFLLLVLPAAVAVELLAAVPKVPRRLVWALRLAVAASAAPVLLYGSSYLTDAAGPGTREWPAPLAAMILGGLGAALAAVWTLLAVLTRRPSGRSVPVALAVTAAGAALTVMLSGYLTGGQLGLPLAAALAGAAIASLALRGPPWAEGAVGVGVIGLYGLLVIGRFFGDLTTAHAVALGTAPLLCWLPEAPYLRRLSPRLLGVAAVALAAFITLSVVAGARQQFIQESRPSASPSSTEPSAQDYMDYGR